MPITGSKMKLNGELSVESIVGVAKTRRMIETLNSRLRGTLEKLTFNSCKYLDVLGFLTNFVNNYVCYLHAIFYFYFLVICIWYWFDLLFYSVPH